MRDLEASAVNRLCRAEHWTKVDYKITSNIFALSENWNLGGGGASLRLSHRDTIRANFVSHSSLNGTHF